MDVAILADGRVCKLIRDDVDVQFSNLPGWSLVARPLEVPILTHQTAWWVQSTEIKNRFTIST